MLLKIIKNWFEKSSKKPLLPKQEQTDLFTKASDLNKQGRSREAIAEYKKYLKHNPTDAVAINDLGVCFANIGDLQEAHRLFELAYLLDDSQTPAIANHAKLLADQKRGDESYAFLKKARALEPEFRHIDTIYASLCMNGRGTVSRARHFQLRAWGGNFDTLRYANSYLFFSSYDDINESLLAAEHRFWAETLKTDENISAPLSGQPTKGRKIRIGYWSPDYRVHSVTYFFRPLQENHDRERFEIFVYHDAPSRDEQTECIERVADSFHPVFELTDEDLASLFLSHKLDILVELAGHTSNNRINLLRRHLAPLTITALGYPPTTGLGTINAKLLDRHILTPDYQRYYSEAPLVLPSSFWCFDPMEAQPAMLAFEPPAIRNGYVTFASVGNIAKINNRIMKCWAEILRRIPRSRLLIRSINFDDPTAESNLRDRLDSVGVPVSRVDFRRSEGGKAFFESYNDIDIILDTYPFNGGTTTCFAVYMGVPVVTWAGASLISRMGLSIMTNLDAADLAAHDADTYIRKAVTLSQDIDRLKRFKRESRELMRRTGLGNGEIFAREFEQACVDMLSQVSAGVVPEPSRIDVLPADEIVRRAYDVLTNGQMDAAQRILKHCLHYYPNCGSAHILYSNTITGDDRFRKAAEYLTQRLESFDDEDRCGALMSVARNLILAGLSPQAAEAVAKLKTFNPASALDQAQIRLYQRHFFGVSPVSASLSNLQKDGRGRIHCIIPCDDLLRFHEMHSRINQICIPSPDWNITFQRCEEARRVAAYEAAAADSGIDILVLLQKNIDVCHPGFFLEIVKNLRECDMLGYVGATRWVKLDWIADGFEYKSGGFLSQSSEREKFIEIFLFGPSFSQFQGDMQVLTGEFIALRRNKFSLASLNKNWEGAEYMIEQVWSNDFFQAGGKLGVHRGLGLLRREDIELDRRYWGAVRLEIAENCGFELFEEKRADLTMVSLPAPTIKDALKALERYFR